VTANTDTTADVHDTVTTMTSVLLDPFRAAVTGGAPWVMVSLATYDRIDPRQPAAYSPSVITRLLRGRLGFDGVVVSDSLRAQSARSLPVGERAAALISAGGDVALTDRIALLAPMVAGVRARAAASSTFRAHLNASVLRVLTAKSALGLLPACR
jgi:beta-N-acetylhexosaminidase